MAFRVPLPTRLGPDYRDEFDDSLSRASSSHQGPDNYDEVDDGFSCASPPYRLVQPQGRGCDSQGVVPRVVLGVVRGCASPL